MYPTGLHGDSGVHTNAHSFDVDGMFAFMLGIDGSPWISGVLCS